MIKQRRFAVEQIEGAVAVLLDEERHQIVVPLNRLPRSSRNGVLLSVPLDETGTPHWSAAAIEQGGPDRGKHAADEGPQK
jgi:hypothetical protein